MKKTPTCNSCHAPVKFVKKAEGKSGSRSEWVVLDPDLLNPHRQHDGRKVRIVDAGRAYTIQHAREHVRLGSEVLARPSDASRIEDLQWFKIHDCPNRR